MTGYFFLIFFVGGLAINYAEIIAISGKSSYSLTYDEAALQCQKRGGMLATRDELEAKRQATGYTHCSCGWLLDKSVLFPVSTLAPGCGDRTGLIPCTWRSRWNAFCFVDDIVGNCAKPMGMESGAIKDSQLSSSSSDRDLFLFSAWEARRARLNNEYLVNAWMPDSDNVNEYIEVDLETPSAITGIITQGASRRFMKSYVTAYKIYFSKDGHLWFDYGEDGITKVFKGNSNNNGYVRNMFRSPILAKHIRICPYNWHNRIALRFELLGCDIKTYKRTRDERNNQL